jgi:hypothetical protein
MAVSTLTLNSVQPTSIVLNYSLEGIANGSGYYYTLYRGTTSTFASAARVSGFGSKDNFSNTNQNGGYTDTGLASATSYYYWLQGYDGGTGLVRSGYPKLATSAPFTTTGPPPTWSDQAVGLFTINTAYSDGVVANNMNYGGVYSISSGFLPTGISLNTSTGAITGTPTAIQNYYFIVTATNNYGSISTSAFTADVRGGIKIYNGTSWATSTKGPVKIYNGTSWASSPVGPVYVYDGSAWVPST